MEVVVTDRKARNMGTFNVDPSITVEAFKAEFSRKNPQFPPCRQWYTLNDAKGKNLKDNSAILSNVLQKGDTLVFKDLGW